MRRAGPLAEEIDDVPQIAADVVVERKVPVGVRGNSPINQVGVEAGVDEVADDALVRKDVEDVGTVHQREDEQERGSVSRPAITSMRAIPGIVEKLHAILFIDDFMGSSAFGDLSRLLPQPRYAAQTAELLERFPQHGLLRRKPGGP